MTAALRTRAVLAAVLAGLCLSACAEEPPPRDGPHALLEQAERFAAVGRSEAARRSRVLARRQLGFLDGWDRGHPVGWERALREARTERPATFRRGTLRLEGLVGAAALLVGLLAGFLAAGGRRREEHARDEEAPRGLATLAVRGVGRGLQRLGQAFEQAAPARVRLEDPHRRAVALARDTERHLVATRDEVDRLLARADQAAAAACREAVEAWRGEVADLRGRLERVDDPGGWTPPGDSLERLDRHREAADRLRVDVARAGATGDAVDALTWARWRREADGRPARPDVDAPVATPAAWARTTGLLGLVLLVAGLLLTAAWCAAGAAPTALAATVLGGGLAATLAARAELVRGGRRPLLAGPAERVARGLTGLGLLAGTLLALSSSATAESGLDLGEPPPFEEPAERIVPAPPPARLPGAPSERATPPAPPP